MMPLKHATLYRRVIPGNSVAVKEHRLSICNARVSFLEAMKNDFGVAWRPNNCFNEYEGFLLTVQKKSANLYRKKMNSGYPMMIFVRRECGGTAGAALAAVGFVYGAASGGDRMADEIMLVSNRTAGLCSPCSTIYRLMADNVSTCERSATSTWTKIIMGITAVLFSFSGKSIGGFLLVQAGSSLCSLWSAVRPSLLFFVVKADIRH